jgi:uncharacterized protein (TIGR04255 family)
MLKQAPLALALCQVKFGSLFGVKDQDLVAFQKAVKLKYPIATRANAMEVTVNIAPAESELKREARQIPQWQFTDHNDNWKIVLSQDFLSLEARAYQDFDEFLDRLSEAMQILTEHINPTSIFRIGLRYVNEIRSKTFSDKYAWSDIIHSNLLGPLAIPEFTENALHGISLQQLALRYPENIGVNIHHGLIAGGTAVQRPINSQDINDPFYLLDFDVFRDFPHPQVLEVDHETVINQVREYHKIIYQLFRWSVTQEYISILEG